ncbi:hypothetical protein AB0L56_28975 [Streptomyces sp. NPDC052079]|uniref:hypothetical protein n=1 Tax=Streptomyces sp. NPDC052079 TaxID=3155526 RepID=UPI003420ED81
MALWVAAIGATGAVIAAVITGIFQNDNKGSRTECSQNTVCGDNNSGNSINGDKNEPTKP